MRLARARGLIVTLLLGMLALPAWAASSREFAQTQAQLAIEYMRYGNMRAALDAANASVDADSGYQSGHMVRALVLMQLGMDKDAESAFRRALSVDRSNPEANNNYGWFLCSRGQAAASLEYFSRALSDPLYDKPMPATLNRGLCRGKAGDPEGANRDLLEVLRADGKDAAALRAMTELQLTRGNGKLAAFYYQRLSAQLPREDAADLWLGVRLARLQGDTAAVRRLGERLLATYPDSVETQQYLSGS